MREIEEKLQDYMPWKQVSVELDNNLTNGVVQEKVVGRQENLKAHRDTARSPRDEVRKSREGSASTGEGETQNQATTVYYEGTGRAGGRKGGM